MELVSRLSNATLLLAKLKVFVDRYESLLPAGYEIFLPRFLFPELIVVAYGVVGHQPAMVGDEDRGLFARVVPGVGSDDPAIG
ncbi:hypothetical protein B1218_38125 [Pseudomonas ogarae]|nr:hypothetical protein B1218_38125 [Pseudomonas ogarae]